MTYVLCCGDRAWTSKATISKAIMRHVSYSDIVLQGGNGYTSEGRLVRNEAELLRAVRGADALAAQAAANLGHAYQTEWAAWDIEGRAAGPIRNGRMLKLGPRLVLAFHDNLQISTGTKDMVKIARRAAVPVILINSLGQESIVG